MSPNKNHSNSHRSREFCSRATTADPCNLATLSSALDAYCRRYGYDHATALDQLVNTTVHFFEWDDQSPSANVRIGESASIALFDLMRHFFLALRTELEHKPWADLFGDYFMTYGANVKDRGQCFTPDSVCEVLASISMSIDESNDLDSMRKYVPGFGMKFVANDCACGSARLLLAAGATYRRITKRNDIYLTASDIDDRCCRQAAINILVHGHYGEVICMDTLMGPTSFSHGWIINSGLYPIPYGLPSLQYSENPADFFQLPHGNALVGNPPFTPPPSSN